MLTAYSAFMNEGLFNNPSVSLPNQGFGLADALWVVSVLRMRLSL